MKKLILVLTMAALMVMPLFAQATQEQTTKESYETLQMYTALDTEEAQYYLDAFEKSSGIKVEYVRMSSGEVLARVEAEKMNPQASVWFGGSNTDHINAKSKDLLIPYKPKTDFELEPMLHADDYSWNGFYTGAIGFVSNTDFLKKNNLNPPTSWDDLLNPVYKGQIEMAYPYTSGTAYTTLATIIQMKGLEGALDWWQKFDANIHQYTKSGTACIARAGLGECGLGIGFSHDIIAKGIALGYPLVLSFPKEGTGYEVGAVSMLKGAKQVKEAQIFMDWCFSVEAQNLFKKYSRLPVNPKATVAEGAVKLSDIKLINYNAVKMGMEKDANVEAWRNRIGK
ncbi:ABC transporter substrate-binding protein [uncultured Sphaerochaeta sp.]|uniref:ABC transporter substrate-binding protein n=1 Tax=uncultured Sphaerochaeta sp. TaxID=886478 RepID=UPI002A0A8DA3|nr:ABC transporter substrate-binding protein [uncultured Sphaerochaeta sp.]